MQITRALWQHRQPMIKFLGKRSTPIRVYRVLPCGIIFTDTLPQKSTTPHTPTQHHPPTSYPSRSPRTGIAHSHMAH